MSTPTSPDLVKVTEIYLIPNSFLVAALGTADTNLHRAAVSLLGFTISVLWWVCVRDAQLEQQRAAELAPMPMRMRILSSLSVVFVIGWLVSTVIHALLYNQRLGP